MGIQVINDVLKHSALSPGANMVLVALSNHADNSTRQCYPGMALLARTANLSERQVQKHIRSMIAQGIIAVKRNAGPGGTNLYTVLPITCWTHTKSPSGDVMEEGDTSEGSPLVPAIDTNLVTPRHVQEDVSDTNHATPKPSVEPSVEPSYANSAEIIRLRGKGPQPTKQVFKEEDFSDFWTVFPDTGHKNDPTATKALFRKIVTGKIEVIAPVTPSGLIDAARNYADTNPKYAMKPANWLEKEAWASHQNASPRRRGSQAIPYFGEITR